MAEIKTHKYIAGRSRVQRRGECDLRCVGDEIFRRAPVTPDMILMALEHGRPMHNPLTANV